MHRHQGRSAATALIGVGAAFDFHSGRVRWAPRWMRRLGIEWVHRLAMDPRRMWRRYLVGIPAFLWHVMGQRARARDAIPGEERPARRPP